MNCRRIKRLATRFLGVVGLFVGLFALLLWWTITEPFGRQPALGGASIALLSLGLLMLFTGWLLTFHPRWILKLVSRDEHTQFDPD